MISGSGPSVVGIKEGEDGLPIVDDEGGNFFCRAQEVSANGSH